LRLKNFFSSRFAPFHLSFAFFASRKEKSFALTFLEAKN
jgi:hypothetical protein